MHWWFTVHLIPFRFQKNPRKQIINQKIIRWAWIQRENYWMGSADLPQAVKIPVSYSHYSCGAATVSCPGSSWRLEETCVFVVPFMSNAYSWPFSIYYWLFIFLVLVKPLLYLFVIFFLFVFYCLIYNNYLE